MTATLNLSRAQQAKLEKEMQRRSCLYFATQNLAGPPEEPYNGRFIAGEHHYEWDDLAANAHRACILAPRDHGKSFFWNKAFPIWKQTHVEVEFQISHGSADDLRSALRTIA